MFLDQLVDPREVLLLQIVAHGELDRRLEPEVRLAVGGLGGNVDPRLLTREEVEAKPASAENRRAHLPAPSIAPNALPIRGAAERLPSASAC